MELSPSSSCPSQEDSFVWDANSQLYYHARSGFYHDPTSGWYYNSRDGLYYSYCDGQYVLLDANDKGDQSENFGGELGRSPTVRDQQDLLVEPVDSGHHYDAASSMVEDVHTSQEKVMVDSEDPPDIPPPTSEWLEDTLIDLFLSRNSARAAGFVDNEKHNLETLDVREDAGNAEQEGVSWEEENWRAQYGQAIHEEEEKEEPLKDYKVTDLWDWGIAQEPKPENSPFAARLVGRLVHPSTKVHPSMPSGGKRLKTSPISCVRLDLVQVKSGQVFRLRTPSASYLATLALYDSSNPTKDWGFPEISRKTLPLQTSKYPTSPSMCGNDKFDNHNSSQYRDRAAERRALHGSFNFGPGQRTSLTGDTQSSPSSPSSLSPEEAAAEALQMSLGPDSYAQRILKNMGWKEGDALGKTGQGLTSPIRVVENKGNAGLGYMNGRR